MITNDLQAFCLLDEISKDLEIGKMENLVPQFLRSGIEIFSHQIYASTFALSNPFVKGFILADEAGLGKTMEALLILAQYRNSESNILVVVPAPTVENWLTNIIRVFHFECVVLDNKERTGTYSFGTTLNSYKKGVLLTTYDYLNANFEKLQNYDFHLCILDEAHRFRNYKIKENKTAEAILTVAPNAKKILLTATPIQKNEDDIFGLINFIDESIFTDYDEFHKRYFRKPENYPELRELIAPYTFRTLRSQVKVETQLPERQILTQIYQMNDKEKELYSLIENYVAKNEKQAFPEMNPYELSLMLYGSLSSSAYAISKTLSGIFTRLNKNANEESIKEAQEIRAMLDIATSITSNNKDIMLLKALKQTFSTFYRKGIAKKCVIFTSNIQTQEHIHKLLMKNTDYNINSFNGTTDDTPVQKFLLSDKPSILISTDKGNESLNWQSSAFIINYDFPQVLLDIEQRISRCHRIGQATDVFVLNFICPDNFFDVRMYELFYKRMNISNNIIGASDSIISGAIDGDIETNILDTLNNVRKKKEVQIDFSEISEELKKELTEVKVQSNDILFNTFDKNIVEKTKNMAEIIKRKVSEMKEILNEIARYYFKDSFIDDNTFETKTSWHNKNPFGYPFKYSLIGDVNCHKFDINCEPCNNMISHFTYFFGQIRQKHVLIGNDKYSKIKGYIGCFKLRVQYGFKSATKTIFVGFTENGELLSADKCKEIMLLNCVESEAFEIEEKYVQKLEEIFEESKTSVLELMKHEIDKNIALPISHIKMLSEKEKSKLSKEITNLQKEIEQIKNLSANDNFSETLAKNQKINELSERLFELKDNEFLEKSRINKETNKKVSELFAKFSLESTKTENFMIYFEVR